MDGPSRNFLQRSLLKMKPQEGIFMNIDLSFCVNILSALSTGAVEYADCTL